MNFPEGRYWWMSTNPDNNDWKLLEEPVGVEDACRKYNENGKQKTAAGAFNDIQAGDWILGYVGGRTNPHGVYSLLQCTHALTDKKWKGQDRGPHFRFKKIRDLDRYIPWSAFAENPILKKSHMVMVHNAGSLFGFNAVQQKELLKVLRRFSCGAETEPSSGRKPRQRVTMDPAMAKAKLDQIDTTVRLREALQREGQRELREYVMGECGKCAVTGLSIQSLLVVSHIKDWSVCTDDERLDSENVLLLARNVDAVFDRKLISFDSSGKIVKSDAITWRDLKILGITKSAHISRPRGRMAKYLKWHRERLVKGAI